MPLSGRLERLVLAVLTLGTQHAVSIDHLVLALWGDDEPESAVDTIHSIISRLRHKLGSELIERVDHSYRLTVCPDDVDSIQFERLLNEALGLLASDTTHAHHVAREALGLWRGDPFGGVRDEESVASEAARLEELRDLAVQVCLEADVASGRHRQAIPRLRSRLQSDPYNERLWRLLATALSLDGRRVEALRACQDLRSLLAEAGVEPGEDLQSLERSIATSAG